MKIGIGFPLYFRNVGRELLIDWLRKVDDGPFDVVTGGERLVYPSNDLMVTLGITAAITERVEIITVPLYLGGASAGVVAKQVATLDTLTHGRFVLGVGIGVHEDDFLLAGASWADRTERFDEQLQLIRRVWAQEPPMEGVGVVGPAPTQAGGPQILVGSWEQEALASVGTTADGVITFGFDGDPANHVAVHDAILPQWQAAGRAGAPRVVAGNFFALGPDAESGAAAYLSDHYGWLSPDERTAFIEAMGCKTPEAIRETVQKFEATGVVDTLFFTPTIASLDQVDRLIDALTNPMVTK
jgi:alkanesulfonate monooxygenase SsuD/methylene tetrahydromethanopterin reductase-like flavin-dependent oxidoreductase (luciferase family)